MNNYLLFELTECAGDVSELANKTKWCSDNKICSTPKKGRSPTRQIASLTAGQA